MINTIENYSEFGLLNWTNNDLVTLMNYIEEEDSGAITKALGNKKDSILEAMKGTSFTLSSENSLLLINLMNTPAGKAAQEKLAKQQFSDYLYEAHTFGIRNYQCKVFYAVLRARFSANQLQPIISDSTDANTMYRDICIGNTFSLVERKWIDSVYMSLASAINDGKLREPNSILGDTISSAKDSNSYRYHDITEKSEYLDQLIAELNELKELYAESGYSSESLRESIQNKIAQIKPYMTDLYNENTNQRPASINSFILDWVVPSSTILSQRYGDNGYESRHLGIDVSAPQGTPVITPCTGKVVNIRHNDPVYGNMIDLSITDTSIVPSSFITPNKYNPSAEYGVVVRYSQLQEVLAEVDEELDSHSVIGYIGDTGNSYGSHLHLELIFPYFNTEILSRHNPETYFNANFTYAGNQPIK